MAIGQRRAVIGDMAHASGTGHWHQRVGVTTYRKIQKVSVTR
jgi:hypothetical protein